MNAEVIIRNDPAERIRFDWTRQSLQEIISGNQAPCGCNAPVSRSCSLALRTVRRASRSCSRCCWCRSASKWWYNEDARSKIDVYFKINN